MPVRDLISSLPDGSGACREGVETERKRVGVNTVTHAKLFHLCNGTQSYRSAFAAGTHFPDATP